MKGTYALSTAVVSGAGTGIGRAIALRLAQEGHHVILLGRREAFLRDVSMKIRAQYGENLASYHSVDLTDVEATSALVPKVAQQSGGIEILVNNAGGLGPEISDNADLVEVAYAWDATWRKNTLSAALLTTALLPYMRTRSGRIIFISSIAALRGGGDSYGSAKAALHGFAFALSRQLAVHHTTVNVVAPGFIEGTEFFKDSMTDERRRQLISSIPARHAGMPEDVAEAVAWLTSPNGRYVTGQVIQVNGGALLGR